jgi:hypothetical protein
VTAAELATALTVLRDDAPEPVVCLFVAKASDVEGSTGLLGSRTKTGDAFLSLATKLRESFTFVWTADADAAAKAGVKPGTAAVLHSPLLAGSKLEPAVVPFSGSASDADALEAWLWGASLPLVGELTARTSPRYAKAGAPLLRVVLPTDWRADAKGANYWLNRLRRAAAAHPSLRFAAVKPSAPDALLSDFGLTPTDAKFAVTLVHGDAKYAVPDGMPSRWAPSDPVESLSAFIAAFEAGGVEQYVKSEPVPEGKANGVTVVVGKTFDAVVLDDTKGARARLRRHGRRGGQRRERSKANRSGCDGSSRAPAADAPRPVWTPAPSLNQTCSSSSMRRGAVSPAAGPQRARAACRVPRVACRVPRRMRRKRGMCVCSQPYSRHPTPRSPRPQATARRLPPSTRSLRRASRAWRRL